MSERQLYPPRFERIYQYRLWGRWRLANVPTAPLPLESATREAWVFGDREDHSSRVVFRPRGAVSALEIAIPA